jgi:drug/metabolite transporter (DMT)-like permease
MARQRRADLALLAVAAIWGATFVMVRAAVADTGPFTFLALRFSLAAGLLALLFAGRLRHAGRRAWAAGALVGLFLFAGYAFQTMGLRDTTASRAGFITGLAVVLVPFVAWAWLRRPPGPGPFAGVLLAVAGLALLAWQPGERLAFGRGDWLVLACAVAFALHIVALGAFAPRLDARALAAAQIATAAGLALVAAAWLESADLAADPPTATVLGAAAFTGLFATAVAFAVQSSAQAHTTPTHVALIFATEPVFAALAGVALAGETLTRSAWAGCALILVGMLTAELWPRGERRGHGRP